MCNIKHLNYVHDLAIQTPPDYTLADMNYDDYILRGLHIFAQNTIKSAQTELREQGHYVTGKTEQSFQYQIERTGLHSFSIVFSANISAIILHHGVSANRVPYTMRKRGQSNRGKSAYIQALLNWAAQVRPELSDNARQRFVFAVAAKAKKEGHPTKGSFAFSKNQRRKGWISFSLEIERNRIDDFVRPMDYFAQILLKRK